MEDSHIKKMAKLLHNGATMLDKNCPQCATILFRMKDNTIMCPKCEKQVVIVKSKEDELNWARNLGIKKIDVDSNVSTTFFDLNNLFASLIKNLSQKLKNTEDMTILGQMLNNINTALDIMQKLRKIENNSI